MLTIVTKLVDSGLLVDRSAEAVGRSFKVHWLPSFMKGMAVCSLVCSSSSIITMISLSDHSHNSFLLISSRISTGNLLRRRDDNKDSAEIRKCLKAMHIELNLIVHLA